MPFGAMESPALPESNPSPLCTAVENLYEAFNRYYEG